jgi:hypothetical protein
MRYSKALVTFCVATVIAFTVAVLGLNALGMQVSDTLIAFFFGMFGVELASCAGITISKVRNSGDVPRVGAHAKEEEDYE